MTEPQDTLLWGHSDTGVSPQGGVFVVYKSTTGAVQYRPMGWTATDGIIVPSTTAQYRPSLVRAYAYLKQVHRTCLEQRHELTHHEPVDGCRICDETLHEEHANPIDDCILCIERRVELVDHLPTNTMWLGEVHPGGINPPLRPPLDRAQRERTAEREARSAELAASRMQRERERIADHEAYQARCEAAKQRAYELLMSLLSEDNQIRFRQHCYILVKGSDNSLWRINCGDYSGNVIYIGTPTGFAARKRYCAHPRMFVRYDAAGRPLQMPLLDAIIAQMLLIETDVKGFLDVANDAD